MVPQRTVPIGGGISLRKWRNLKVAATSGDFLTNPEKLFGFFHR